MQGNAKKQNLRQTNVKLQTIDELQFFTFFLPTSEKGPERLVLIGF